MTGEISAETTGGANPPLHNQDERVLTKVARRLIPYMFCLYILSYLDRINVSFAGLQMNQDLNLSSEDFGFGGAIFFLGYFLFGAPGNLAMEKLGARKWIAGIMIVWGIITVLLSQVTSKESFFVLRFFLGAAEAGFFPGMILYLTYWFPEKQRGLAVAKFMAAIPAAGILGGLISSQILTMGGIMGLAGWKWLFIITGIPSVIMGIVTLFYLTDKPDDAKWLTSSEKSWLKETVHGPAITPSEETTKKVQPGTSKLFNKETTATIILLSALYFSLTLGMYGFQLWLPLIIKNFGGLDVSQIAYLSVIPAIFQALGMIVIAKSSEKRNEQRLHVAASAFLAALGLLLTSMISSPALALATLSLTAFGIWGTVGPFWSLGTCLLPKRVKAAGIGFINSTGNLGGFAGPYIVGFAKQATGSFNNGLYAMALSLCLAGVLALSSKKLFDHRN